MNSSIRRPFAGRARRLPSVADVQRHGWLIGLIAGGLIASWSSR